MVHTVKGFDIVNKTELNVFLELSCFFDDPIDAGNSGSYAFSKTTPNYKLTPWKKSYDQLDSMLKSRDITLPTKVPLVKAMAFPSSHVWM